MTSKLPDTVAELTAWRGLPAGRWRDQIDVAGFIAANVRPYAGDEGFLAGPTARTTALWDRLYALRDAEDGRPTP